jgi:hypothetical protein
MRLLQAPPALPGRRMLPLPLTLLQALPLLLAARPWLSPVLPAASQKPAWLWLLLPELPLCLLTPCPWRAWQRMLHDVRWQFLLPQPVAALCMPRLQAPSAAWDRPMLPLPLGTLQALPLLLAACSWLLPVLPSMSQMPAWLGPLLLQHCHPAGCRGVCAP